MKKNIEIDPSKLPYDENRKWYVAHEYGNVEPKWGPIKMYPDKWKELISWLKDEKDSPKLKPTFFTWSEKKRYWLKYKTKNTDVVWCWKHSKNLAHALEEYLKGFDNDGNSIKVTAQQQDVIPDAGYQEPADELPPSTLPRNLILQGPPGTGKTHLARQLAHWLINLKAKDIPTIDAAIEKIKSLGTDKDQVNADLNGSEQFKMVQFHPATSYEDFVRGIRAKTQGNLVTYEVEHGHLSDMCKEAAADRTKNYVLLVDEINRANLSAVLGECIFALEYRDQAVDTAYEIEGNRKLTIPENLWIIGTMNTADRSVGHLDYAIRRRFLFKDCLGDKSKVAEAARDTFGEIDKIIEKNRSEEFEAKDIQIGHTYFMEADWETRLEFQVKPILDEYLRDGVLKPGAKVAVDDLSRNKPCRKQ